MSKPGVNRTRNFTKAASSISSLGSNVFSSPSDSVDWGSDEIFLPVEEPPVEPSDAPPEITKSRPAFNPRRKSNDEAITVIASDAEATVSKDSEDSVDTSNQKLPPKQKKERRTRMLTGSVAPSIANMPAIDELSTELNISADHLESCKRQTYQRTFRLWMPMVHDFNEGGADEDELAAEMMQEVLPVDELLDRVMLRRVRVSAVQRSLFFLLFNFLYCACLIMQRSLSDSFELESALKAQIDSGQLRFSTDVRTVGDIWNWMENSFVDNMTPETAWYNGDAVDPENLGYTYYYNKQCGGFSLVQHRVKEFSPSLYAPSFRKLYPVVWPDLGTAASTSKTLSGLNAGDDHHSFGPLHDTNKYKWTPDTSGEFEGGGFTIIFPTSRKTILYKLAELKSDRFVDKQTRKLQIIVTVFNANLKLFAVIDFQIFLNAAGQVSTKREVSSVRIETLVDFVDYIRVVMEVLLVYLMVLHTRKEFSTARMVGFSSYLNFWNLIDAARQLLFYTCMVMYISLLADPLRRHPEQVEDMCNGGDWLNFPRLAKLEEDYVFNSALCLLMSTLLIFKFLTPFPKFGIFVHTMVAAGKDLINFVLILSILLFGFAIIGHLLFGHVMVEYSTVSACFESAVLNAIGVFDYPAMVAASSPVAAAIYFFSFVFIITMVVMQMVIAIIFSAYDGLREQIDDAEELEIGPTLVRKVILGRDPSLKELHDPLTDVAKNAVRNFFSAPKLKGWKLPFADMFEDETSKVVPEGEEGERVTPDTFSDAHLLQLFDPQHVFRMYGILSPKMESEIVSIKVKVSKERELAADVLGTMQKLARISRATAEDEGKSIADSWALDREEFCALMQSLDDVDTVLHITSDDNQPADAASKASNTMLIAHHIFAAYGRKQRSAAGEGKFRKRVMQKLDKLIKVCEPSGDPRDRRQSVDGTAPSPLQRTSGSMDASMDGSLSVRKKSSLRGSPDTRNREPKRGSNDALHLKTVNRRRWDRLKNLHSQISSGSLDQGAK